MKFQNQRGGRIVLQDIKVKECEKKRGWCLVGMLPKLCRSPLSTISNWGWTKYNNLQPGVNEWVITGIRAICGVNAFSVAPLNISIANYVKSSCLSAEARAGWLGYWFGGCAGSPGFGEACESGLAGSAQSGGKAWRFSGIWVLPCTSVTFLHFLGVLHKYKGNSWNSMALWDDSKSKYANIRKNNGTGTKVLVYIIIWL